MTGGFDDFRRGFGRRVEAERAARVPRLIYLTEVVPVEGRDGLEYGYAVVLAPVPGRGIRTCAARHNPDGSVEVVLVES